MLFFHTLIALDYPWVSTNEQRALKIRPECTINPRTGGSPWFRPPSLNEAKRVGSLHAAFVIKVMAFRAISLAARLFLLQSQRLIADTVPVCNRFSQGVLHCIVWEEIQGSHLPAQEAAAYHQP